MTQTLQDDIFGDAEIDKAGNFIYTDFLQPAYHRSTTINRPKQRAAPEIAFERKRQEIIHSLFIELFNPQIQTVSERGDEIDGRSEIFNEWAPDLILDFGFVLS